jgi:hypothetical protein
MQDCPLPNGDEGWIVYLADKDGWGLEYSSLHHEGIQEIRTWMADVLGLDNATIDDNVYGYGITFEHEDHALLCYLRFQ